MTRVSLSMDNELQIEVNGITLSGVVPVLNNVALQDCLCKFVAHKDKKLELRYTAPTLGVGALGLQLTLPDDDGLMVLKYWVENLSSDFVLDSFGLRFERVENLRQYLRSGYFSWDGSQYVQPEELANFQPDEPRPETSYSLTQLLPRQGQGCAVLGFDRHDRFQQTFTFDTRSQPCALTMQTWWDRKMRGEQDRCESENLLIFPHKEIENGLREWARNIAAASPIPPRLSSPPITGWCSWYNLYAYLSEDNILEHLRPTAQIARRENLPMRVFQIDDGFNPEMGDWLEMKPQFPHGMKPLLDEIRSAGFIPGLWIAPFMVGNRSRLFQQHPDWVVKDRLTGAPLAHMQFYGEFRWHKRSEEYYILDATHPQALDYLRRVFRAWRQDWGCEYFKIDFMQFGSEYGPDRAVWHTPGLTRIEIWRQVGEMIREEIGDAVWLGCGCPLWASVGLVDAVRIGRDVGVAWNGNVSAQTLLLNQACRNFANHILWQSDLDCVLLRERFSHLSASEIQSLAIYTGMSGGVITTSDQLDELSPQRMDLWRLIQPDGRATCDYPFLGQSAVSYERLPAEANSRATHAVPRLEDPVFVQVRKPPRAGSMGVIFFLNTADHPLERTYLLERFGIEEAVYLYDWEQRSGGQSACRQVSVTLPPHHGALYFYHSEPIRQHPRQLPS